jgi:Kef-type K+ transport system membrane component KefB/CBS domain-containing protein
MDATLSLAAALLASLALGRAASRVGVPRVTAYILVGLALGPHGLLRWLEPEGLASVLLLGPGAEAPLAFTSQLAVGFILFGIGAEFRFETFRRVGPSVLVISGAEITATALLVGAAVLVGTGDWRLATIAPALAVATAPSATLVTLHEVEAEGPVSRCLVLCVGHNNLAALLAFPLLLAVAFGGGGLALVATGMALLALALGGMLGVATAVGLEAIDGRRELVLAGILVVLAALGSVHALAPGSTGLGMLACFGAGMAVVNSSPHAERLLRYVENTVYPLYVLFFIGAGRDLHVEALASAGVLGALFVAARAAGKVYGSRIGLRLARRTEELPAGLGVGLLCQAGVALGLVAALESALPEATEGLRSVVVASVVVFELLGPWLVRRTVIASGEVKLANLLPRAEATGFEAVRWVLLEIRRNLGLLGGSAREAGRVLTVSHAMRRRPETLSDALPFDAVLKRLGETHADLLPVVDAQGRFHGVISYQEVKNTLYDPVLRALVIAEDLTSPVEEPLEPELPLGEALERLDRLQASSWPVVSEGRLVGMMRRSDAYAVMRRGLSNEARANGAEAVPGSGGRSPGPGDSAPT